MTEKRDRARPRIPLRAGRWGGITKTTQFVTGRPGFTRIENGYINADGTEIRRFPGWKTSVDLVSDVEATGYDRDTVDAERPQAVPGTAPAYAEHATPTQQMIVRNKPTHMHGFEFVRGKMILFGESDLRREDIYNGSNTTVIKINSWTGGGATTTLTLTDSPDNTAEAENALHQGDWVLIEGLDESDPSPGVAKLQNLLHEVDSVVAGTVVIGTALVAGTDDSTISHNGGIYRTRRPTSGAITSGSAWRGTGSGYTNRPFVGYAIDDLECLTVYHLEDKVPNTSTPAVVCRPSHVANRQRDFGDLGGVSTTMGEGLCNAAGVGQNGTRGVSRRHQKELPYRLVPDVAEDRLLMVAPGYGCVFQAPMVFPIGPSDDLGANFTYNGVFDKPRCLGVPKGVMLGPQDTDGLFATTGGNMADGTYKVAIAYRDEGTGEIGIASDTVEITISGGGGFGRLRLRVLFPGYWFAESLATSIVVYCSEVNGDALGFVEALTPTSAGLNSSAIYGLAPSLGSTPVESVAQIFVDAGTSDIDFGVPPLQGGELQMPMGSKTCATIRGTTIFGGHLGNVGTRSEMVRGTMRGDYEPGDRNYPFRNRVYHATINGSAGPEDEPFNLAMPVISPAYAGYGRLFSRLLFPAPILERTLERLENSHARYGGALPYDQEFERWPAWILRQPQHRTGDQRFPGGGSAGSEVDVETFLRLPTGICHFSSPGTPGQTPSTSNFFLDNEEGGDCEAIGRYGSSAILCSTNQTYILSWNRTPNGQSPQLVSSEFGCIAPNTMIEFDGGTAWISDRGPVAMLGGGLQWIGRDLERDFLGEEARYRRDSQGMMRHAWACHDAERGLVMFGLIKKTSTTSINYRGTDVTWITADDEAKSRFPCDEVLVWSYRANAFSYMTPPTGLEILWMRHGPTEDGAERVHWLAADKRVYTFDDTYADTNNDAISVTTTNAGNATVGATISVSSDFNTANSRGVDNNHVRIGSKIIVYRGTSDGAQTLVGEGAVTAFGDNPNRDLVCNMLGPDGISFSWEIGDNVVLGVPPDLTITTQHIAFKQNQDVPAVRVEYSLASRFTSEFSLPQLAWMGMTFIDSEGTPRPKTVAKEGELVPGPRYLGISNLDPSGLVAIENRAGSVSRSNAVQLRFIGAAQVRINQIEMELPLP